MICRIVLLLALLALQLTPPPDLDPLRGPSQIAPAALAVMAAALPEAERTESPRPGRLLALRRALPRCHAAPPALVEMSAPTVTRRAHQRDARRAIRRHRRHIPRLEPDPSAA